MVSMSWIDPDGVETAFLGVAAGTAGRGLPPVRPLVTSQPNRSGAVYSGALHGVRRISIPFEIFADAYPGESELRTSVRAWARRLSTLTAPGKLRWTSELGDQREIVAWYVGGLELVEPGNAMHQAATLEFDCPDPYPVDTTDSVQTASTGSSSGMFFPVGPALFLAASEIAAELTIDNTGDLECWPVISVTGPATSATVRNLTSGQVLALSGAIGGGEVVTLDARPGARTVLRQDGASLYSSMTSRQWWPLAKGQNRVRLEATGTTAASQLSVRWRRRWLAA